MSKAYDLKKINEIAAGDESFVRDMVAIFLKDVDSNMALFESYYSENKWKAIGELAHKIKPTIDLLGIENAKAEIRELRVEAESADKDSKVFDLIKKVNGALAKAAEELRNDF